VICILMQGFYSAALGKSASLRPRQAGRLLNSRIRREVTVPYDAVVIGAGLGGLTAVAELSKEGKKVFLNEPHVFPGDCAKRFKR